MSWKKVKLGDILTENKIISENPNPDRRITVRLKVLGVEKRGLENEVQGATKQYIRKAGQFIYGKQNFHKGAFGIVPPELDGFESSSDLPAFDEDKSCLPEFIFYFFKQGNYYLELSKIASGVATQRINTTQLFELELLLPDIKTQRQLISNIQLLEKNGSQICNELTHQLTLVKKLRQQLLQDAVQGKLVEQNKKDEPASELLKKIKAEKKFKKELPPLKPEELSFEIPSNWTWCRLGEIAEIVRGGSPRPAGDPTFYGGAIPFLKVGDLTGYEDIYVRTHTYSIKEAGLHKTRFVEADTLMLTNSGATLGIPRICTFPTTFNDGIAAFLNLNNIDKVYLYYFLKSKSAWYLKEASRGQGQPNLNTDIIALTPFPLPPLNEQKRIVDKLEQAMQNCNNLEENIKQSESQNEKLLQQVLREALRKGKKEVVL